MINTCKILSEAKTIAVIGFSRKSERISRNIASYLHNHGYIVYGVNPGINEEEIDGMKVFKSLTEIPDEIDIVDVFRKPQDIPEIIPDVLAKKPKVLWLQLGIRNDDAVQPVIDSNIVVIQDECIFVHHSHCF